MHMDITRTLGFSGAALLLDLTLSSPVAALTLYAQDFTPTTGNCDSSQPRGFPAGWTRFDVDGLPPVSDLPYMGPTWTVHNDFKFDRDECVAKSTSWSDPPGAANDFMCTPPIAVLPLSRVKWRAVSYDASFRDSYQVRVMTAMPTGSVGNPGNLLSGSTVVFETPAENTTWTARRASLAAFANQTVYICFRNDSNDKFELLVDDVVVEQIAVDQRVGWVADRGEYSRVPFWQGYTMQRFAVLRNDGSEPLTNAYINASALLNGTVVESLSSTPLASLPGPGWVQADFPALPLNREGDWSIRYSANSDENAVDVGPANDFLDSDTVVATDAELSRDVGETTGALGIGAGNGGELGQHFDLPRPARISGIRFTMHNLDDPNWPGTPLIANLRAFDTVTGKPGALIASTAAVVATAVGGTYDAFLAGGSVEVPAGRYVLTVSEPIVIGVDLMPLPMSLAQTRNVFTLGTTWVIWPTSPQGGWAHLEDFFSPALCKTFRISMLFDRSLLSDSFETNAVVITPPPAPRPERTTEFATQREPMVARRLTDAPW